MDLTFLFLLAVMECQVCLIKSTEQDTFLYHVTGTNSFCKTMTVKMVNLQQNNHKLICLAMLANSLNSAESLRTQIKYEMS